MIKEKLRQEGQILAVDRVFIAINLKDCHTVFFIPIDFITRRMKKRTNLRVPLQLHLQSEETKTKIANIKTVQVVVVDGVRTEVPCIGRIFAQLQPEHRFELSYLLVGQQLCIIHTKVRIVVGVHIAGVLLLLSTVLDTDVGPSDT